MIPYGRQSIDEDDIEEVIQALKSDFLTTGPYVKKFEDMLCQKTQAEYAVVCSNGTTALHLACLAVGIGPGDHVVVPSITFLATANAVRFCGAEVIFCDVDPKTGLMDEHHLSQALNYANKNRYKVKAVMPVHLAGQPVDLLKIKEVIKNSPCTEAKLIADSCHAIGGRYHKKPIGACAIEDISVFSFHPVKTIAMGEGGAITTNDAGYANHMRLLRSHGMVKNADMPMWGYEMHELGYNYRISDIQCALGYSQLQKLEHFINKREQLVKYYNEILRSSDIIMRPQRVQDDSIGWHLYAVQIDFKALKKNRHDVMSRLRDEGILTQVHYIPVHTQPYYLDRYGYQKCSGAEEYYKKTLSLPLHTNMSCADVEFIVKTLHDILLDR